MKPIPSTTLLLLLALGLLSSCKEPSQRNNDLSSDMSSNITLLTHPQSKIQIGVLPQVGGRIVVFRKAEGPHLLKANPKDWQPDAWLEPDPEAPLKAFNGHIYWVSPQPGWGWNQQNLVPQKQGDV